MAKRSEIPVAERREAVLSLLRREESAAVIARRVGVSEPTLYRWREDFLAAGDAALASSRGKKNADPIRRRIADLEHQIEKRSPGDWRVHDRKSHLINLCASNEPRAPNGSPDFASKR